MPQKRTICTTISDTRQSTFVKSRKFAQRERSRPAAPEQTPPSFATDVNKMGSVLFSVKETGDGLPRYSPCYNVLTGLVPSSTAGWLSQGHRCLASGDATPMMPQPTVTENGTDPGCWVLREWHAANRKPFFYRPLEGFMPSAVFWPLDRHASNPTTSHAGLKLPRPC
jgi:hypothetical protein